MKGYLHFGDISFSEDLALVNEGREVTHHVVHRDASGECDTTLKVLALLAGESLLDLFLNHSINSAADGGNISAWDGELDSLGQAV